MLLAWKNYTSNQQFFSDFCYIFKIFFPAQTCDVVVTVNGLTKTSSNAYTYDAGLTPTISGVSPSRGGTGGGTTLTVSGSGFG